jgi:ABC-2 type transport system ATP-binding protein
VHLELAEEADPEAARGVLAGLDGVRDVRVAGRNLSARADDGAAAVPGILAALQRAGSPVASVTVARPSLDDVYLRYTGRRYSEAEAEAGEPAAQDATDLEGANR